MYVCMKCNYKFLQDILNKINRTTLNTWYEIKSLSDRITSLENIIMNTTSTYAIDKETVHGTDTDAVQEFLYYLPLTGEEDLIQFEEKLTNVEFKKTMVCILYTLIHNILYSNFVHIKWNHIFASYTILLCTFTCRVIKNKICFFKDIFHW